MKKNAILVLMLCLLMPFSAMAENNIDSETITSVADLFRSMNMEPYDVGLNVYGVADDSELSGFLDLFPMTSNIGERNEETERYWALYDKVMALEIIPVQIAVDEEPEYALVFLSDGERSLKIVFYNSLNIVDIYKKESGKDEESLGKYLIREETISSLVADCALPFLKQYLSWRKRQIVFDDRMASHRQNYGNPRLKQTSATGLWQRIC